MLVNVSSMTTTLRPNIVGEGSRECPILHGVFAGVALHESAPGIFDIRIDHFDMKQLC